MNKFKGLDLANSVPEELWKEVHTIVQEVVTKTIPKKKKCKKTKWLFEEALQIADKRREVKGKRERYTQLIQSSRGQQREMRKLSEVNNAQKQRKTIEWKRLESSSRKSIPREHLMQRWAQ